MLEPDARVVLLDQLRPPPGYRLSAAVATTFTLDLSTAVIPPLAFASFEIRGTPDPVAALEAVRACTDRVDIFCQAGQIVVPGRHSDLMAYLEPMVHPVRRPKAGFLFHPKVWFLGYQAEGEPERYRLLCSTRNLTDSHAWDAVVTLDGVAGTQDLPSNRPLAALIRHLPQLAVGPIGGERVDRVRALAAAAMKVQWDLPENVNEVTFHAFGVPRVPARPDFSGYRHLVVSPFCDDAGIAELTELSRGDVTIVSRPEALDQLRADSLEGRSTFILNPLAVLNSSATDSEDAASSGSPRPDLDTLSGLHAKLTVVERHHRAHVFIGSPNATSAGYGGNVEFAVELRGGASKLGVDTYVGGGAPFAELLQEYKGGDRLPTDPSEELLRRLLNHLGSLAEIPLSLTVEPSTNGNGHNLLLESMRPLSLRPGYQLSAELLTVPGLAVNVTSAAVMHPAFRGIPVADITPFVVLFLKDVENSTTTSPVELSTVVHASLINDPEDRLDEILARQVNTPEKFLRFVALLLGIAGDSPPGASPGTAPGGSSWGATSGAGLFELMVNALADHPQALRELGRLVDRLRSTDAGRSILPAGFDALWRPIQEALATMQERP